MTLTVATDVACPTIGGPTDQNVIVGQTGIFTASVAGIPLPTQQWQENGVDIPGATGLSIIITNVSFAQDGNTYSIIATNNHGTATNSAVLHVVVPPDIQVVRRASWITDTQTASFSVTSTNGVPSPTYQWKKNNVDDFQCHQFDLPYFQCLTGGHGHLFCGHRQRRRIGDLQQRDSDRQFHDVGLDHAFQQRDGSLLRHAVVYDV